MFNTLVYIPSILAYTFITLLVVILGFIVIYIAHKIYTTLYDNLPVAQLDSKSSLSADSETLTKPLLLSQGTKADAQLGRKSKTALRIIVTLEPCYLAYMVFESKLLGSHRRHSASVYQNCRSTTSSLGASQVPTSSDNNSRFLIKYFDSLASIPTGRDLQKCDNFKLNNMCRRRRRK